MSKADQLICCQLTKHTKVWKIKHIKKCHFRSTQAHLVNLFGFRNNILNSYYPNGTTVHKLLARRAILSKMLMFAHLLCKIRWLTGFVFVLYLNITSKIISGMLSAHSGDLTQCFNIYSIYLRLSGTQQKRGVAVNCAQFLGIMAMPGTYMSKAKWLL